MSIILPPGADPNDEMIQKAMMAEQQDQQVKAVIAQLQNQVFVTIFTNMAIEHLQSGEPLTIEAGRDIVEQAQKATHIISNGYLGFFLEKIGLATVDKVEE